jgi:hypothetical protein
VKRTNLNFRVFRQPPHLWGVRDCGGLGLGDVGPAVGQLVEAFVVLHVQGHVAHLTLEARLVPDLQMKAIIFEEREKRHVGSNKFILNRRETVSHSFYVR